MTENNGKTGSKITEKNVLNALCAFTISFEFLSRILKEKNRKTEDFAKTPFQRRGYAIINLMTSYLTAHTIHLK